MKNKKYLGSVVMVFCLCSLLVFTFGFLPAVLSAPPENRGIELITIENIPPEESHNHTGEAAQNESDEFAEQPPHPDESDALAAPITSGESGDSGDTPENTPRDSDSNAPSPAADGANDIGAKPQNINAITREQAIEVASAAVASAGIVVTEYGDIGGGAVNTVQTDFRDARYVESTDPFGDPSWFVVFSELTGIERYVQIPDDTTADEFLAANNREDFYADEMYYRRSWIGVLEDGSDQADGDEEVFIMATAWVRYIVAEVNALTGEFIERGVLDWTGVAFPFEAFYGDIREYFVPWSIIIG